MVVQNGSDILLSCHFRENVCILFSFTLCDPYLWTYHLGDTLPVLPLPINTSLLCDPYL